MSKGFKHVLVAGLLLAGVPLLAEPVVSIDKVKQRYPWNGLVDVEYTVSGVDNLHRYSIEFEVKGAGLGRKLRPISSTNDSNLFTNGPQRAVFDLRAYMPEVTAKPGRFFATITEDGLYTFDTNTGATFQSGDYLIWDMRNRSITVRTNVSVAADFNIDEYKRYKMVFRRVPAGKCYLMGTTENNGSSPGRQVAITKDYYIGIFEVTKAQHNLAMTGLTTNESTVAQNLLSWNVLRGTSSVCNWPSQRQYDAGSAIGKMNSMLPLGYHLDLPTEAQWERAYRAGSRTQWFWGSSDSASGNYVIYKSNYSPYGWPALVGSKLPNAWGIYDIAGNMWEWMLDWYSSSGPYAGTNPVGPSSGSNRVYRGGGYHGSSYFNGLYRTSQPSSTAWGDFGYRLVLRID